MHLVGILFPHINDDARSKPHKTCDMLIRYDLVLETTEKIVITLEEQGDRHCGLRLTISGGKNVYQVAITVQGKVTNIYSVI